MMGSHGAGIAAFQHALLDAGYVMPRTFKRGIPRGTYDADTRAAVATSRRIARSGSMGSSATTRCGSSTRSQRRLGHGPRSI